ncbi:FAD-dependent monooxygenase [Streptomyces lincolnensis]|uniref:FAD-dependent monooxygenase n=1 Tax=Streptomyces lincolnensis TaxID=1915 RepID=UPI0037D7B825
MSEGEVPVVIIGGGPVGLASALFLRRLGVDCVLLERRPTTSPLTRATGVHARSMELFRNAGVEQPIRDAGLALVPPDQAAEPAARRRTMPRIALRTRSLDELAEAQIVEMGEQFAHDLSPAAPVWCGQDLLEPVLLDGARRDGADIRFGHEALAVEQDPRGVTVTVADKRADTTYRMRAHYVIAADGVYSPVRERLGVGRSGHGLQQRMISMVFRADLSQVVGDRRFMLTFVGNERFRGVVVCLDGQDRWMVWTGYPPDGDVDPADFDQETCLGLVRAAIGRPDHPVELEGTFVWESTHLIADSFRTGRIFLAGDAAHTHPPHGSFGANAGVQDAHNLAWKLAARLRGQAGDGLLDTYEAERRPVGAATADQALLRERHRATAHGQPGFRDFPVVILGYRYASRAVLGAEFGDEGPLPEKLRLTGEPGTRVPHVWLSDGRDRVSTVDLCTDDFVLLSAGGSGVWPAAAERVSRASGVTVRAYRVGEGADLTVAADPAGVMGDLLVSGAVLIRPDGFVAWHAEVSEDAERSLARVLATILDRPENELLSLPTDGNR